MQELINPLQRILGVSSFLQNFQKLLKNDKNGKNDDFWENHQNWENEKIEFSKNCKFLKNKKKNFIKLQIL